MSVVVDISVYQVRGTFRRMLKCVLFNTVSNQLNLNDKSWPIKPA